MIKYVHHAMIYTASDKPLLALPLFLRKQSEHVEHKVVDAITIKIARDLKLQAQRRFSAPHHFVIVANNISTPAQNALLKLIEEPPANVYFHFVLPTTAMLLPTVLSRVQVMTQKSSEQATEFVDFNAMPLHERLDVVAKKTKEKDMTWMRGVLYGSAEETTGKQIVSEKNAVLLLDRFLYSSGASRKMLLEHLVLSFGQTKK